MAKNEERVGLDVSVTLARTLRQGRPPHHKIILRTGTIASAVEMDTDLIGARRLRDDLTQVLRELDGEERP